MNPPVMANHLPPPPDDSAVLRDASSPLAQTTDLALAHGFAERMGQLARMRGASAHAVRRLERAAYAVSRATAQGHVCIHLSALPVASGEPAEARRDTRAGLFATGLVCDGLGPDAALAPLVLDAADRLYLARYFAYERQLARALLLRAPNRIDPHPAPLAGAQASAMAQQLAAWFGAPQTDQIDWQRVAAALALSGRLTVISGGPGTGKTSTVVAILASLLAQSAAQGQALPRIALAAPTGKAAQRMQEALQERAGRLPPALAAALPQQAYTLHRLLGVGPDGRFRHQRDVPLPYDVVVVDEASMIDVALAARLIDAVPPDSRLILLGDKDQLAAVEAGAVFAELSLRPLLSADAIARLAPALGLAVEQVDALLPGSRRHDAIPAARAGGAQGAVLADCVIWLERNYRFGLSSPIGRLSLAIRDGNAHDALAVLAAHPDRTALVEDGETRLSDVALARLALGYASYARALGAWLDRGDAERGAGASPLADPAPLFDAFNLYRVLCATRAGARGVLALNRRLAARIRQAAHGHAVDGASSGAVDASGSSESASGSAVVDSDTAWYPGRPVMVTRNDYAMGLFNGDIGIALPTAQGLRVAFRQAGGGYRWVSPATLPQHETAFALTVHKSQGSEFAEVAVVLPATTSRVLTRELVYTAVTRARERVVLYAAGAVLAQAIAARTERDSGLAARLTEARDDAMQEAR